MTSTSWPTLPPPDPARALPPPPPPLTPEERVARSARDRVVLVAVVFVAALVDLWWRTPMAGTAFFLAIAVSAALLFRLHLVASRAGRALVVAAVVPAAFVAVRASTWLVPLDIACALGMMALGVTFGRADRFFDQSFGAMVRRAAGAVFALGLAPKAFGATVRSASPVPGGRTQHLGAVVRGLVLVAPVLAIVGGMLASADAVFASMFDVSIDGVDLATELVFFAAALWFAAALFVHASRPKVMPSAGRVIRLGVVEACVVLSGLIVVYGLFAVARLLVAVRGADYVLSTTGLSYAEYARTGFFQLLWAGAITLVVLFGLRATVGPLSGRGRRAFAALSIVAVALTLVLVHAALLRLALYIDAFGLTMLRLSAVTLAWWIGAMFVLTGVALAGVGRGRSWLAGAVVCSAAVTLAAMNVANPEALVVESNLARTTRTGEADVSYLAGLSDDAVPALVANRSKLTATERAMLDRVLCQDDASDDSWNLAARRAADARRVVCGQRR